MASTTAKMAILLGCWYLFLVSLDLMSSAFKLFAGQQSLSRGPKSDVIRNPVVGIMTGLLVTVLVQSSSSSTSITITLVGSQLLSVKQAIPIVMGANLGSSVTSSVAALSQVTRRDELRRAFAVATAHCLFNWLTLVVLLPFEVTFAFLESSSRMAVEALDRKHRLHRYNHLRALTRPLTSFIVQNALARLQLGDQASGLVLLFLSLLLMLGCLSLLARTLSPAVRLQVALSRMPQGLLEGYACFCLGLVATLVMQSSTALSSALALLAASAGDHVAGMQRVYPVLVGANIGTTSTGLLAALAGDPTPDTLQLALCHSFFNVYGALLFYPVPFMRFPVPLAQLLAATAAHYRWFAVAYLLAVFVTLPLLALLLSFAARNIRKLYVTARILAALFLTAPEANGKRREEEIQDEPFATAAPEKLQAPNGAKYTSPNLEPRPVKCIYFDTAPLRIYCYVLGLQGPLNANEAKLPCVALSMRWLIAQNTPMDRLYEVVRRLELENQGIWMDDAYGETKIISWEHRDSQDLRQDVRCTRQPCLLQHRCRVRDGLLPFKRT
ncbi:hypothetical protein V5799_018022 [Amblyomma americanum]|uniref:Sodium-dependent phosphate transporter n=1 Tax=Amblyomma americanum TaxID=6943 RepID=A0AAQ4F1P6_AMBAM